MRPFPYRGHPPTFKNELKSRLIFIVNIALIYITVTASAAPVKLNRGGDELCKLSKLILTRPFWGLPVLLYCNR